MMYWCCLHYFATGKNLEKRMPLPQSCVKKGDAFIDAIKRNALPGVIEFNSHWMLGDVGESVSRAIIPAGWLRRIRVTNRT